MTEKELFVYRRAVNEYESACDELREFCPAFYAAHVSRISGLPKGEPPASPDGLSCGVAAHSFYIEMWERARLRMENCRAYLAEICELLEEENERRYFYLRYVSGLKPREIIGRLHRSSTSLSRDRQAILARVADLPPYKVDKIKKEC